MVPSSAGLKLADATTSTGTSELRRLSTLLEISQTLAAGANQKNALHQVLGILDRHHSIIRSTVALLAANGDIEVVASEGPPGGKADAKFRLGEGITGRVVQSSKPIVVPRVSREPMFLRRTSDRPELAREEISYVCVPDSAEPEGRRRARRRLPVQGRARFRPHGEVPRGRRLAHGAVDSHPARHRRRTGAAARGKHAPQERAARALRFLEHPRHERPDAARVRAGVAGRAHRHDRAHPRRVGHRQRADRAGHPLQLAAGEAAVHQGELRGAAGEPHRIGAVRLRKRGVHRRARDEEGTLRARRGGHALSR